ncbi:MAG: RDD family protein [Nitrososphaerota archaeon]|nr:RDD family protein [Nitrososphaerota archaeon]
MFCPSCGKEVPAGATFCPACGASLQGTAGTSAPVSGMDTLTKDQRAQQYWVERLVAIIIDWIILGVIFFVVAALVAIPALLTGGLGMLGTLFGGLAFLYGLIFVLYNAAMETNSGASIGKKLFHLKVISKEGKNPTFGQAFIRNLSKIYWLLLLLDVIIGLAVSKDYHGKYSDHFIGTTVVRS